METKEKHFLKMIQQHEQTIYTICYMFSQDKDEVDDLYQDILLQLWQGYDTFEGRSGIRTWIYRVSLNYCINFQRKQKREREQKELLPRWNPDESLERKLQVKQLYQRINALELVDRSVVLLWLEGLSYEEIAAIIGISVKNVSFKLVRIREQLKSMSNH